MFMSKPMHLYCDSWTAKKGLVVMPVGTVPEMPDNDTFNCRMTEEHFHKVFQGRRLFVFVRSIYRQFCDPNFQSSFRHLIKPVLCKTVGTRNYKD